MKHSKSLLRLCFVAIFWPLFTGPVIASTITADKIKAAYLYHIVKSGLGGDCS